MKISLSHILSGIIKMKTNSKNGVKQLKRFVMLDRVIYLGGRGRCVKIKLIIKGYSQGIVVNYFHGNRLKKKKRMKKCRNKQWMKKCRKNKGRKKL